MHYSSSSSFLGIFLLLLLLYVSTSQAQLSPSFYDETCPQVFEIATKTIVKALRSDPRIAASLLRLHFHDCFVNGCDASILLDNSTSFRTEKDANANAKSARGFDVIDKMKASVEKACPNTVSCADLLAIAAQESVVLAGGPSWMVPCGRRDGLKGFMDLANVNLPAPFFTLKQLKDSFKKVGLDRPSDLVALSGGHTFGKNQCRFIMDRLYNFSGSGSPDPTLDKSYLKKLRKQCPLNGDQSVLLDLDFRTPTLFDNKYYVNLKENKGLIQSDQEIFSSPDASDTIPLVRAYADGKGKFFNAFVEAMIRMGNLSPLTGEQGEIRLNCRVVNSRPIIEDGVDADDCGSDDCVSVSDESISDDCVSDECVSSI